jgi:hypothetical protein
MLADTLSDGTTTFSKVSADAQSGSVYHYTGDSVVYPDILTIKHTSPGVGKKGTTRHLFSLQKALIDAEGFRAGSYVTVNFTVTFTDSIDSNGIVAAVLQYFKLLSNATAVDTITSNILDGMF